MIERTISLVGGSDAEANKLSEALRVVATGDDAVIEARRSKSNDDSMDFGTSLVLILGTGSVVALANGIAAALAKNSGAKITIRNGKKEIIASGLASADAAKIAKALVD